MRWACTEAEPKRPACRRLCLSRHGSCSFRRRALRGCSDLGAQHDREIPGASACSLFSDRGIGDAGGIGYGGRGSSRLASPATGSLPRLDEPEHGVCGRSRRSSSRRSAHRRDARGMTAARLAANRLRRCRLFELIATNEGDARKMTERKAGVREARQSSTARVRRIKPI